jgi:alpha-L-rhamnosidase
VLYLMGTDIARGAVSMLGVLAMVTSSSAAPAVAAGLEHGAGPEVSVVDLSIDSLPGDQLGIGDTRPTLAWRMTSQRVRGNPCFDDNATGRCALDRQIAYEVETATDPARLRAGRLLWDTGRVASGEQTVHFTGDGIELGGNDTR